MYDYGAIAAQFKRDVFAICRCFKCPTDRHAAGKAQRLQSRVLNQGSRRVDVAGKDTEGAGRQTGLQHNRAKRERRKRRPRRGLDDD